jgi:phosphoserine phosphatase
VPADIFERLKLIIKFTPGAVELCRALKRLGCKLAVLSGGFTPLVEWLATQLGIDYAFANNVRNNLFPPFFLNASFAISFF